MNGLTFNEELHQYTYEGKTLTSVTQFLKEIGVSPDYSGVNPEFLKMKADYGSAIHKEIEEWVKERKLGFSDEVLYFKAYIEANKIDVLHSELMVNNDKLAGTIDLIVGEQLNGKYQMKIVDIKTTFKVYKQSVSWQLSIYLYLYANEMANGISAKEIYDSFVGEVYHISKESIEVVKVDLLDYSVVEETINSRSRKLIVEEDKILEIEQIITDYKRLLKTFEQKEADLKQALIESMEKSGVYDFESDTLKITYVAGFEKQTIDTAKLKTEDKETYEKYLKTSYVKPSVRITLKEKNE